MKLAKEQYIKRIFEFTFSPICSYIDKEKYDEFVISQRFITRGTGVNIYQTSNFLHSILNVITDFAQMLLVLVGLQ